jgi:hypothetical protein
VWVGVQAVAAAFPAFAAVVPPSTKKVARVAVSTATRAAEFPSSRHLVTALVCVCALSAAHLATGCAAFPSSPRILSSSSPSTAVP